MKKHLLFFSILLSINLTYAQVVFCPAGAEWHYLFKIFGNSAYNIPVKYIGDSSINNVSYKKLKHQMFYKVCGTSANYVTLLKQNGDTVFFRNAKTQHSWQVLYNFALLPGQSWNVSFLQSNGNLQTYTITVDSIKNVLIGSINHKRLYVKKNFNATSSLPPDTSVITERLGWNQFFFNFIDNNGFVSCDGPYYSETLCYSDNTIGTIKYSPKSCDYENYLGLNDVVKTDCKIVVYPNPSRDNIRIKLSEDAYQTEENFSIIITDMTGNKLKQITLSTDLTLSVGDLNRGIYFIELHNNKNETYRTKFVKE